jgi:hypothetical protein
MKKRIILIVMALALVIGALAGGITYAQMEHQPIYGNKLVGTLTVGYTIEPQGKLNFAGHFVITNPDCLHDIIITRLAVLDTSGDVIMEGPPGDLDFPVVLGPHQSVFIPVELDLGPVCEVITAEIAWEAKKGTCPLTGVAYQASFWEVDDIIEQSGLAATPMVNFKQRR